MFALVMTWFVSQGQHNVFCVVDVTAKLTFPDL